MQVSSVAIGVFSLYTYPIITVILEPLFSSYQLTKRDLVKAMVVLAGVGLIVPELSFSNSIVKGVVWGLLSAFLFALRNVLHHRYAKHNRSGLSLLYQMLGVIFMTCFFIKGNIMTYGFHNWQLLVLLGVVIFTALPHTLYVLGLKEINAKTVSLISCLQVIYSTIFAAILLNEIPRMNMSL